MICEYFKRNLEEESKDHRVKYAEEEQEAVYGLLADDVQYECGKSEDRSEDEC